MDLTRFKECSAAYGAERRRWPQQERALFDHFAHTAEGMTILADAGRLDSFLDGFELAQPSARHIQSIGVHTRPVWFRLGPPAVALAACAALGFIVGSLQSQNVADPTAMARLVLGPESLQEFGL